MSIKTLQQIHQEGLDLLVDKLGPADAIRFLRISETGSSDWTKDRKKYLEKDLDKIIKNIMERRKKAPHKENRERLSIYSTKHSYNLTFRQG